ncbi:MAG: Lacal_2735 family protein [Flavobacteriales bacterium]|nr:Lacal_2735 family protein [Flavobacteriales bacterium]
MFGLFKKPDEKERLEKAYRKLLEESFRLSTSNRKASDLKRAEAEAVLKRIEEMKR